MRCHQARDGFGAKHKWFGWSTTGHSCIKSLQEFSTCSVRYHKSFRAWISTCPIRNTSFCCATGVQSLFMPFVLLKMELKVFGAEQRLVSSSIFLPRWPKGDALRGAWWGLLDTTPWPKGMSLIPTFNSLGFSLVLTTAKLRFGSCRFPSCRIIVPLHPCPMQGKM